MYILLLMSGNLLYASLVGSAYMSCRIADVKLINIYLFNCFLRSVEKFCMNIWRHYVKEIQIKVSYQNENLCHALLYCCLVTILCVGLVRSACTYIMQYFCLPATMLCVGLVGSECTYIPVLLLLTGDHASCGSYQQCMYICYVTLLLTSYYASCGFVGSAFMSCNVVAVWWLCFVQVLSAVHVIVLLLLS